MAFQREYENTPDSVTFEFSEVNPEGDLYGVVGNILEIVIEPRDAWVNFKSNKENNTIDIDEANIDSLIAWLQAHKDKLKK